MWSIGNISVYLITWKLFFIVYCVLHMYASRMCPRLGVGTVGVCWGRSESALTAERHTS